MSMTDPVADMLSRIRNACAAGDLTVGAQYLTDCLTMPVLLVGPEREERRDLGITMRAGDEQVT